MKRKLLLLGVIGVVACQGLSLSLAATSSGGGAVSVAIRKYKAGNYTGCLQDTQSIVSRDPSNALAYYYMAMAYVQAGQKDKAIDAYQKVLNLRPNSVLSTYATTGKRCIETPDKCHEPVKEGEQTDMDKIINSNYSGGLSDSVRTQVEQKRLERLKQEMNTQDEVNNYKLRKFTDYTKQRSQAGGEDQLASTEKMPTNDEIVAAVKVLNRAGLSQYSQSAMPSNVYSQMANPMMTAQNPESAQLSMMLGGQNQSGNNNMMNMIPFMLAQSKNGESGNPYTPQLMQSMLMNSMIPDFSFNTNDDNR